MGPIVGIRELLSMLRRRAVLVAFLLSVGVTAALAFAISQPHSYQAIALLQIQPSPLSSGASGAAAAETTARFRLIEQRIMSRENIAAMIERHQLFEDLPLTGAERISTFRSSVSLELIPALGGVAGPEGGVSGLFVTVRLGDPAKAAELANDLADQIVTDNRSAMTARLRELTEVLETDDLRLQQQLSTLQDEYARIRRDAGEALPDNGEMLQTRITTLETLRTEIVRSQQELERERLAVEVAGPVGETPATPPTVAGRIGQLRIALARATAELGAGHPEVRRLRQEIDDLRRGTTPVLPAGMVRQIELIDQQLSEIALEREQIQDSIKAAQAAVTRMPAVAERIDALSDRRNSLLAAREALATRLAEARLGETLVQRNQADRMEILERATPPDQPLSSSRRRIAILGIAASIALSVAAAFVMELRNPVVRSPRQLQTALGAAAIATAPRRPSPAERLSSALSLLLALALLVAGGVLSTRLVDPDLFPSSPEWLQPLDAILAGDFEGRQSAEGRP